MLCFQKSDPIKRDFVCKRCDSDTKVQVNQVKPMIFPRKMGDERLFQFSSIVTTSASNTNQHQQSVNNIEEQPKKRQLHYTAPTTENSNSIRKKLRQENR